MLCFEFLKDIDLKISILSCEETIRYSAYRDDGVFLAVTVVFKVEENPQGKSLYAVHPRTLDNVRFASNEQWQGNGEEFEIEQNGLIRQYCFPVQHIYSKICDRRMVEKDGQHYVKLFQSKNIIESEPIPVSIIDRDTDPLNIAPQFDRDDENTAYLAHGYGLCFHNAEIQSIHDFTSQAL